MWIIHSISDCKITIKMQKRAPVSANNCIFSHPLAQQALLMHCGAWTHAAAQAARHTGTARTFTMKSLLCVKNFVNLRLHYKSISN